MGKCRNGSNGGISFWYGSKHREKEENDGIFSFFLSVVWSIQTMEFLFVMLVNIVEKEENAG